MTYILYFLYFMFFLFTIFNEQNKCKDHERIEDKKEECDHNCKDHERIEDKKEECDHKRNCKYEDKYLDKYEKMCKEMCKKECDENADRDHSDHSDHKSNCKEESRNYLISSIMENTPQGNVLMFYDTKRGSFIYYSDHTIPYRYLEVVGRKYVITYNCCHLFYNMKQELENAERKIKEDEENKEAKRLEEEIIKEEEIKCKEEHTKPSVFAKLKKYNTNTVNTNSVKGNSKNVGSRPITTSNVSAVSNTMILKENANRYSYEGKMANYNFLKKPEKKVFSFADFKKMNENK